MAAVPTPRLRRTSPERFALSAESRCIPVSRSALPELGVTGLQLLRRRCRANDAGSCPKHVLVLGQIIAVSFDRSDQIWAGRERMVG
jgi:hypothetical protein